MKKNKFLFFSLMLFVSACSKNGNNPVDEFTTLEVESSKVEVADIPDIPHSIPIPEGGIDWSLPKYPSATEAKKFFEDNKTSPNFINTVKAKSVFLKITAPPGSNFDCMDRVKIYLSTNLSPEVLVGQKTSIPKGTTQINTEPLDVELKNYFIQDTVYFRVEPHFVDYPPSNGKIEFGTTFKVSITASKAL